MKNNDLNKEFFTYVANEIPQWDDLSEEMKNNIATAWTDRKLAAQWKAQLITNASKYNDHGIDCVNDIEKADARFDNADARLSFFKQQISGNDLSQEETTTFRV